MFHLELRRRQLCISAEGKMRMAGLGSNPRQDWWSLDVCRSVEGTGRDSSPPFLTTLPHHSWTRDMGHDRVVIQPTKAGSVRDQSR